MTDPTVNKTEILERRASVVRSRLLRTIDALDQRRHRVVELGQNIERKAVPVGAAVGGLIAVVGTVAFAAHRISVKRHENEWRNVLARTLGRSRPERPSFIGEAARKVGLSLLVLLVNEGAKRAVHHGLGAAKNIDGGPRGSVP